MSALTDRFTHDILALIESGALEGSFADFVRLSGKSLELRTQRYHDWRKKRVEHGVWPFSTQIQSAPGPEATVLDGYASYRYAATDNAHLVASELGHPNASLLMNTYRNRVRREDAERYFNIRPAPENKKVVAFANEAQA